MSVVSERWASALLEIAKEDGDTKKLKEEIKEIINYFDGDFLRFLTSLNVDKEIKKDTIKEVFRENSKVLRNFICLLIDMGRIKEIKEIFKDYLVMANDELNIKEVKVISAREIDKDLKEKLEKTLKKKLNTDIELNEEIDERLISGIKVIIDGKVIDVSMQKKLNEMRKTLLESW